MLVFVSLCITLYPFYFCNHLEEEEKAGCFDSIFIQMYYYFKCSVCLFVCFAALSPKSAAMVMAGRSVHLTTLFSWASLNKQLTSTSCTHFRL